MLLRISCLSRRRRLRRRAVEERLHRYGRSFAAPPEAKQAGLERVLAEFERQRGPEH